MAQLQKHRIRFETMKFNLWKCLFEAFQFCIHHLESKQAPFKEKQTSSQVLQQMGKSHLIISLFMILRHPAANGTKKKMFPIIYIVQNYLASIHLFPSPEAISPFYMGPPATQTFYLCPQDDTMLCLCTFANPSKEIPPLTRSLSSFKAQLHNFDWP